MSGARTFGFGLLGMLLGAIAGGVSGLLGGLAWTQIAGTSGFEGYSGFVVACWIIAGIVLGLGLGLVIGLKRAKA